MPNQLTRARRRSQSLAEPPSSPFSMCAHARLYSSSNCAPSSLLPACSAYASAALYTWALLAPFVLRNREFR